MLIDKFCNLLMRSGNKTKALGVLNTSLYLFLQQIAKKPALVSTKQIDKGKLFSPIKEKHSSKGLPINEKHSSKGSPINEKHNSSYKSSIYKGLPIKKVKLNGTPTLCDNLESLKKAQNNLFSHSLTCEEKKDNLIPETILSLLVENLRPCIEIRKVRVARALYLVPAQISKRQGQTLALRWIIEFAKKRKLSDGSSFAQALAQELNLAHKKQGPAIERRSQLHRLAQANRSYMHYRWW